MIRMNDDLLFGSIAQKQDALKAGEISCAELVQLHLDRIEAVNPQLNAVVQLNHHALEEAIRADQEKADGRPQGPLHGIPMTIKDSFRTKGLITTAGTLGLKDYVPEQDATVVKRLKEAGAILLGKTNTPEITLRFATDNYVYGATNNPYDLGRIPGGSSGGAVSIIAAGGSAFDIGTDTGGSIRTPAHFCGICGLKPTNGRVPRTGHIPFDEIAAVEALTVAGPLARYVSDLGPLLSILSGPDGVDPSVTVKAFEAAPTPKLDGFNVAFFIDNGITAPDPDTVATLEAVISAVERVCGSTREARLPNLERSEDLWRATLISDGGASVSGYVKDLGTQRMHHFLNWTQEGTDLKTSQYMKILTEWKQFQSRTLSFMQDFDLLICPVAPQAAPSHSHGTSFNYCFAFNLLGWPVVVVRCGTSSQGLPIGVQIVARPWEEHVALSMAQFLEDEFGGYQRPSL